MLAHEDVEKNIQSFTAARFATLFSPANDEMDRLRRHVRARVSRCAVWMRGLVCDPRRAERRFQPSSCHLEENNSCARELSCTQAEPSQNKKACDMT